MSSVHALYSLVMLVTSLTGADFWSCVSFAKSWWFTEWLAMISERGAVYSTKRTDPNTEPWGTPYMSCDGKEDELLTKVTWCLCERYDWNHCSRLNAKIAFRREKRIWWSIVCRKLQKDPTKEQKCCRCPERREYHLQHVTKRSLCWLLLDRLTEGGWWGSFVVDNFFKDIGQKWSNSNSKLVFYAQSTGAVISGRYTSYLIYLIFNNVYVLKSVYIQF